MPSSENPRNPTLARHLESGNLEARAAGDHEIASFWSKAHVAHADARNASSSPDNRLLRAYDAGRIAATAIIRAGGFRVKSGEGHHFVTFDVARSLVTEPALRTALDEMSALRTQRHALEYEPEDEIDMSTVEHAVGVATRIINTGADHLRGTRPAARARFAKVKSRGE